MKLEEKKPAWSEEDERIKKRILLSLQKDLMATKNSGCNTKDLENCIAWLKKQHIDPYNGVCFDCYGHHWGMCARDNGIEVAMDGKPVRHFSYKDCEQTFGGKSALEAINEEKVDNSNSVNNIPYNYEHATITQKDFAPKQEPKFHEGEWIIRSAEGFKHNTYLVKEIKDYYACEELKGRRVTFTFNDVHKNFKSWDISDAKDGDVLVDCLGNICIYQEPSTKLMYHSYCYGNYKCFIDSGGSHEIIGTCPATKEQRDLLFQKMKEAGYEWDAEKKELKEIEQEDEEYNGEDYGIDSLYHAISILEKTLGKVEGYQTDDGILSHKCAITAVKKLYNKKPAEWSEEDETGLTNTIIMLKEGASLHFIKKDITKAIDWLKSLKERLIWQPVEKK